MKNSAETKEVEIKNLLRAPVNENNKWGVKNSNLETIYKEIIYLLSYLYSHPCPSFTQDTVKSCHENCLYADTHMNLFMFNIPILVWHNSDIPNEFRHMSDTLVTAGCTNTWPDCNIPSISHEGTKYWRKVRTRNVRKIPNTVNAPSNQQIRPWQHTGSKDWKWDGIRLFGNVGAILQNNIHDLPLCNTKCERKV